jgi:hypothetical protein
MNTKYLLLLGLLFVVVACGAGAYFFFGRSGFVLNRDRTAVIKEIRELNRLETAQFTIEKIIDGKTDGNALQQLLFGDKILFIAHGEVVAGVDMSKIVDTDIVISERDVTLQLPSSEIFSVRLDNDKSAVYDRQQGLLNRGNKDLESQVRQAAEQSIRDAACQGNILVSANTNAEHQLQAFLQALNFEKVVVKTQNSACR